VPQQLSGGVTDRARDALVEPALEVWHRFEAALGGADDALLPGAPPEPARADAGRVTA
jgi:hypothetical protein